MKVRVAYIEEPPFYRTAEDRRVVGSDIELAEAVLGAIGVTAIKYVTTSFDQLLPGVNEGRWDMNVPSFVAPERAQQVAFSRAVWALGDGFVLQAGNPKALTSYKALAACGDARLGVIAGKVQVESALAAGVGKAQMVVFADQPEAVAALLEGRIDAFAGTGRSQRCARSPRRPSHSCRRRAAVGRTSFSRAPYVVLRLSCMPDASSTRWQRLERARSPKRP